METMSGLFPEVQSTTRIDIVDRLADWRQFLESSAGYKKQLSKISREYPSLRSLTIDYHDIEAFGTLGLDLADELLEDPDKVIKDIKDSIRSYNLVKAGKNKPVPDLNIRIIHLTRKVGIRDIRTTEIGKLISVEGIIRKVNDVRPRIETGIFRCPNGHTHIIEQGYGLMDVPDRCPTDGCNQRRLDLVPSISKFVDVQRARIQESPEGLAGGAQPRDIDIDIKDDITDILNAGDRAVIVGVLRTHQRMKSGQRDTLFDIYLDCNSIELPEKDLAEITISSEDEERIKTLAKDPNIHQRIRDSIAPSIFGQDDVKNAISLMMFSGVAVDMPDGTRLRGDVNVLLIGDPGIAKSQMLRYVTKISPRSVFTTGQSTTGAGLTATAVKDEFGDGRWTVEAGALVMADLGIAAVDELEKLTPGAQNSLLEAMEQQTVTCTKAGMNVTLKSRCALLGAANPKYGRFDPITPLADQFNLPPPLLSRFDLIFICTDVPETGFDTKLAEHICESHEYGEAMAQKRAGKKVKEPEAKHITPPIDPLTMRQYIAWSKRNIFPRLSKESKAFLISYYVKVRGLSNKSQNMPVSITARQMEGLIRLAEASARRRLSEEISEVDAREAVDIVDKCLKQIAYNPETGTFDIDRFAASHSKVERDGIEIVTSTIRSYANEHGIAERALVVRDILSLKKMSEHEIEKLIDTMALKGVILKPKDHTLKVV